MSVFVFTPIIIKDIYLFDHVNLWSHDEYMCIWSYNHDEYLSVWFHNFIGHNKNTMFIRGVCLVLQFYGTQRKCKITYTIVVATQPLESPSIQKAHTTNECIFFPNKIKNTS